MPDMSDVRGMIKVIAAVEKSVIEKKPLLLSGPPGIGKTMIARRIPSIMPPMTIAELEEVSTIYDRIHTDTDWTPTVRPFRCPHHTISTEAILGKGGRNGEVDLATHGVLFIDELPEFAARTIERLGHWMRKHSPRPLLIASTNPCPCGWNGHSNFRTCACGADGIFRYRNRVQKMAKMLDIEDFVDVAPVSLADLRGNKPGESSADIQARIVEATG